MILLTGIDGDTLLSIMYPPRLQGMWMKGRLLFFGIEKHDDIESVRHVCQRVARFRLFPDDSGWMNLSVSDIEGSFPMSGVYWKCESCPRRAGCGNRAVWRGYESFLDERRPSNFSARDTWMIRWSNICTVMMRYSGYSPVMVQEPPAGSGV